MCYCMHMLQHRLQILLDEQRYRKLSANAERQGVSIAALVRAAIDNLPDPQAERRRRAIASFLAADPIPLPDDPADLRRELDEAHDRLPK
jgi:hypothetical protein